MELTLKQKIEKYGSSIIRDKYKEIDKSVIKDWKQGKVCQIKHDGWHTVIIVENGLANIYGRQQKYDIRSAKNMPDGIYIGELIENTQAALKSEDYGKVILFGVLEFQEQNYQSSYPQQIYILKSLEKENLLPEWMKVINTHINVKPYNFYQKAIKNGNEGIIIRDLETGKIYKVKKNATNDYVIMGYEESTSKTYFGKAIKSLIVGLYKDGILTKTGRCCGMTDEFKMMFYENQEKYLGNVVEIIGKDMFDSGAIRHPSFLKLRPDKTARECIMENVRYE